MKKIGFLGVGAIALHHLKVLQYLGCEVPFATSISTNSESWKKFANISKKTIFVHSAIDLFSKYDLDAIIVCLPWHETEQYLDIIFSHNIPALIEKPAALSAKKLKHFVSKYGNNIYNKWVGYNRRFYKTVEILKNRILSGGLKVVNISISEDINNHTKKHGKKIIPHLLEFSSSHILDLLLYLFGKVEILKMFKYPQIFNNNSFHSLNGILEAKDGLPIILQLNSNDPSSVGIFCKFDDNTTWSLSPLEKLTVFNKYEIVEEKQNNIRQYIPSPSEEFFENNEFKPGFKTQMREFLDLNKNGKLSKIHDQLETLNLIEKIRK